MKIKFSLNAISVDLTNAFKCDRYWWLRNCDIDPTKTDEQLTDDDKKKLAKLAIYEGHVDTEQLANHPDKNITILP